MTETLCGTCWIDNNNVRCVCENMRWYLLRSMTKQEKRVTAKLEEMKIEFFCPEIERSTNKGKKITELMFPGYLFIRLDKDIGPFDNVRENYSSGALQFVRFTEHPSEIRPSVIELIKMHAENLNKIANEDYFGKGDTVRVTDGPFQDFKALYKCRSGKDRAIVLLSVCGRITETELKPAQIERVNK